MVESSDLQAAIQRTQAMERVQALQAQQEELNRKRFELEMARERAEKGEKVQDSPKAERKRVVRDRYEGSGGRGKGADSSPGAEPRTDQEDGPEETPGPGGRLDVRV